VERLGLDRIDVERLGVDRERVDRLGVDGKLLERIDVVLRGMGGSVMADGRTLEGMARPGRQGWQWGASALLAALCLASPIGAAASVAAEDAPARISVIVQETVGSGDGPENAVARLGGRVERYIGIIDGFTATVPRSAVAALRATRGVRVVTENARVRLAATIDGWDHQNDDGSLTRLTKITGATSYWKRGFTGQGVDVAIIDSGVAPVEGLRTSGKVVNGPDLSFESQEDSLRHLDTFGHGTHMAGIIGARDSNAPRKVRDVRKRSYLGMAPDARIVSLKVADRGGATDVSQVIAAIDWVVQHRNSDGFNIRVLNLSFGTDGVQDYRIDPLAYAAEVAWHKGIVVVASAGNAGFGSAKLNNPAYDPYVIAVGGSDPKGTDLRHDDDIPAWSSVGDGARNPDLVAPGKSVVSLRVPGSAIDIAAAAGRVGNSRFLRGSGTSQAAAMVSGAAALVISQRPDITPDQLKGLLVGNADKLEGRDDRAQGAGTLDLDRTLKAPTPQTVQTWPRSTGTGSLDAARGSQHLENNGVKLDGERDIFGQPWDGRTWSADAWNGRTWSGGTWNGSVWTGSSWTGSSWSGSAWTGSSWSGSSWSGSAWTGSAWTGSAWTGSAWTGSAWTGSAWTGSTWSGGPWSFSSWGDDR
jgi:serine protease AprX